MIPGRVDFRTSWTKVPLCDIADSVQLTMTDLAIMAKIGKPTLSRMWTDPDWTDHVKGSTIAMLMGVIPDLSDYLARRGMAARLDASLHNCRDAGLDVAADRLDGLLIDRAVLAHVPAALDAMASIVRMEGPQAVAYLYRCWGADQDKALDVAFAPPPRGLLVNHDVLLRQATQLAYTLDTGANALNTTVGRGILVHKLTKIVGDKPAVELRPVESRCAAFAYRSRIIGELLHSGDLDLAHAYQREVTARPVLAWNEFWSMASYCGDIRPTPDHPLMKTGGLRRTAAEIVRDVAEHNDAYLLYLCTTAVPMLLSKDHQFGGAKASLGRALISRIDLGETDERLRIAASRTLRSLQ